MRHRPQLQQPTHPAPQEPRQQGHHQASLASAAAQSSPCRFLRHLALQDRTGHNNSNLLLRQSSSQTGTRVLLLLRACSMQGGGRVGETTRSREPARAGTHQKDRGMRRPPPQLMLVQVTWSSSVFWRHLVKPAQQQGGERKVQCTAAACRTHAASVNVLQERRRPLLAAQRPRGLGWGALMTGRAAAGLALCWMLWTRCCWLLGAERGGSSTASTASSQQGRRLTSGM